MCLGDDRTAHGLFEYGAHLAERLFGLHLSDDHLSHLLLLFARLLVQERHVHFAQDVALASVDEADERTLVAFACQNCI